MRILFIRDNITNVYKIFIILFEEAVPENISPIRIYTDNIKKRLTEFIKYSIHYHIISVYYIY